MENLSDKRKRGPCQDGISLKGHINLKVFNPDGTLREEENICNVIVNRGKAVAAGRLLDDVTSAQAGPFDYIALGTSGTAAAATQTTLGSEITTNGGERSAASGSRETTSVASDTAQLVNTFNFTGTLAIQESGIFNDANSGDMLARQTFTTKNVNNGDSLQVTWQIAVS